MQPSILFIKRIAIRIAILLAIPTLTLAQNLNDKLPSDTAVTTGKLDNGLTYYIRPNHKPEKVVELRLVVKAGSILETDEQQGIAHFMEHMNFNGTKNFQKNQLVSYLQSIGVQFGADLNANTGFDQTIYILPIPTDKPGNLEKGFQILEDWAHNALLTDKDIDEERNVILEEARLNKGADDRMMKQYLPKLVEGSLYANRLPIGKEEILKTFTYDKIRNFYTDWYRPDLEAVVIVGDIDVATAKKMLIKHFSALKNPAIEKERTYITLNTNPLPDAMVVTDKEATSASLLLKFPLIKKTPEVTLADYRNNLLRSIAIRIINRRLNDIAIGKNAPFIGAGVGISGIVHGYEGLECYVDLGTDGVEKPIYGLIAELKKVQEFGFAEAEIELERKEMMSSIEVQVREQKTTESKGLIDEYIRAFTDNEPFPGINNEYTYFRKMLPGIKLKELNACAQKMLDSKNTFALITAPDKPELKLPTQNELLEITKKAFDQKIIKDQEMAVATSLIATLPQPGKIVAQQTEDIFKATTYTLSNGIKVTVKPTTFKSDEILMRGIRKGGANNYDLADKNNVTYATTIMDAMGYGPFTPTDIERILAGKQASANVAIGEISDVISAASTQKDLETMFQLVYLQMMKPRKDSELFKSFCEKSTSSVKYISANPQAVFSDTVMKVLYQNNPKRKTVIPTAADFEQLNMTRAIEIYKNEFSNADGFHFFITGNVEEKTLLPLLEMYLGSIPATNKTATFKDNGVRPIKGNMQMKVNKGKEKQSLILEIYTGEVPYSEDLALKTAALTEVLNIKVIENLREKMGAIYGGGFSSAVVNEPYPHYTIELHLPCGPENVDTLLAAAHREIANLKTKGPDPADLEKVKTQWREKRKTQLQDNGYWLGKMENILYRGMDKTRFTDYDKILDKLKPADIKTTAQQLITPNNQFIAIMNPE